MMNKTQDMSFDMSWAIGYVFLICITILFLTKVLFVYS